MPAMLDDPSSQPIQRWPSRAATGLPADVRPRRVTLRDGETRATILPFASKGQIPSSLLHFLCGQLNREIEAGDTYPMVDAMQPEAFGAYWFQNFAAVMLVGALDLDADLARDADWSDVCLGSYYVRAQQPRVQRRLPRDRDGPRPRRGASAGRELRRLGSEAGLRVLRL